MQDQKGKLYKKKKQIPSISTPRKPKKNDQILSQSSPITGTSKNTIETKRSMQPGELKSFRKSNKIYKLENHQQSNIKIPLFTKKLKYNKKLSIQKFIKENQQSNFIKEKLMQQKIVNQKQKKLFNLQKLQIKTNQIFENTKKLKQKTQMKKKLKRFKLYEIIKRFQEISKRYEKIQLNQIAKFQSKVVKYSQSYKPQTNNETQININQVEKFNKFNLHQAAFQFKTNVKNLKRKNILKLNYNKSIYIGNHNKRKQVHISNFRSSIISEDSSSFVNQLDQEFDNQNVFTQRIVEYEDTSSINKQMQQQIISIVQKLKQYGNIANKISENEILKERKQNLILNYRKEALNLRYNIEQKSTTQKDQQLLDEWLNRELEDLQNTRKAFEIRQRREISTLKKIQRDILITSAEPQFDLQDSLLIQQIQQYIDEQFIGLKVTKQNQKSFKNIQETVNVLSIEIINEMITDFSEEILNKKDDLYLIISQLFMDYNNLFVFLLQYLISNNIDNLFKYILDHHKQSLIKNMNTPFGFTPLERLRLIHGNQEDEVNNDGQEFQKTIDYPLDETIYIEYKNQRKCMTKNDDEIEWAILELQRIHNIAIFDACNEVLNHYRPYYQNSDIKHSWEQNRINLQQISNENITQLLEKVKLIVSKQSKVLWGFYPPEDFETVKQEKQDIIDEKHILMLMQQLSQVENPLQVDTNVQFDNLDLIRDEQLYKLLKEDIKEQEYKWDLIENNRVEYLMELSDQILETLIDEFSKEI
ncbi:unnamed protein product [Paramecium primaurelia]|uniref:DUF4378 domain-containing protein n=1 Tax=Paramecium primaurelia TaxID=5886 RepID=A0A8S1JWI0_PARPR|nr:unnamed protein product [Paramecium primaurelia]